MPVLVLIKGSRYHYQNQLFEAGVPQHVDDMGTAEYLLSTGHFKEASEVESKDAVPQIKKAGGVKIIKAGSEGTAEKTTVAVPPAAEKPVEV